MAYDPTRQIIFVAYDEPNDVAIEGFSTHGEALTQVRLSDFAGLNLKSGTTLG